MTERIFRYLREQQPDTPCLVIDLDVVENNYRRMRELLPAAHIVYAVKANPAAQILSRLAGLGSKFDTASRGDTPADSSPQSKLRQCAWRSHPVRMM